jgi:hypothetical protein
MKHEAQRNDYCRVPRDGFFGDRFCTKQYRRHAFREFDTRSDRRSRKHHAVPESEYDANQSCDRREKSGRPGGNSVSIQRSLSVGHDLSKFGSGGYGFGNAQWVFSGRSERHGWLGSRGSCQPEWNGYVEVTQACQQLLRAIDFIGRPLHFGTRVGFARGLCPGA